jgi:hypothetical protein
MGAPSRRGLTWLLLLAALFVPAATPPLAAATGLELGAAPLSAAFLRYQADFKITPALDLDGVQGFQPGLVPARVDVTCS